MTKKKVVVRVSNMDGRYHKCSLFPNFRRRDNRWKALQIASAVPGLQSLSLKGTDMIEVIADGVDAVKLTNKLRKNVGYADLKTVDDVKEEKKDEQPKVAEPLTVVAYPPSSYIVTEPEPACCVVM